MAFVSRQIQRVSSSLVKGLRHASSATFNLETPFLLHRLEEGPSTTVTLTRDDALKLYKEMKAIRELEAAAEHLYKDGKIHGFCHLYTGQEAGAVGIKAGMTKGDAAIGAYRCHGWVYLDGATMVQILAEMTGRLAGIANGKSGSVHMHTKNFYGGNAIIGSQQSMGTGIALSLVYRNKKNMCVVTYGDGAANQGQLYESLNMAKLWSLPVIYICENNGFAMNTGSKTTTYCTDYYTRGDYVPGIRIDGSDVLAVRESIRFAKKWTDAGKGPLMFENMTYRFHGHSMGYPGTVGISPEEIEQIRKNRDPIVRHRDRILGAKLATSNELAHIDDKIREEVDHAVVVAMTDIIPPVDVAFTDVYHNTPPISIQGITTCDKAVQKFRTTSEVLKSLGR